MKQLKLLGLALVAMFALGITVTSAFALPDISITLGGAYPLHLNFADNGATVTKLESGAGTQLEGKGVSILLLTGELTALGTFRADFLNVTRSGTNCNSVGDATNVVLTEGSFHIVYTNLSPLTLGTLFLPKTVIIDCGKLEIEVKGDVIAGMNGIGTEATEAHGHQRRAERFKRHTGNQRILQRRRDESRSQARR